MNQSNNDWTPPLACRVGNLVLVTFTDRISGEGTDSFSGIVIEARSEGFTVRDYRDKNDVRLFSWTGYLEVTLIETSEKGA